MMAAMDLIFNFVIVAAKQLSGLMAWVFVWAAIYAGLERLFPRLAGPTK
jgi:hypothetical protein